MFGWIGQLLHVDLTNESIRKEEIPLDLLKSYIGGRGVASRILYDFLEPGIDPLSPKNVLIFSTGPLTGTLWPSSSRYVVTAKSPATQALGFASSAGHFGPELKFAGYDIIIFKGRAKEPVYLQIMDDVVELKDARHLWGMTTHETEEVIAKEMGDPSVRVACIGPAGEKLVKFAAIINDRFRAAARTGMGAVMGSKNLKAVAVRGTGEIKVAQPDEFFEYAEWAIREAATSEKTAGLRTYGTPVLILPKQEIGDLPTKNHQTGQFPWADEISGETIKEKYLLKTRSCFSCPIHCARYTMIKTGPYAGTCGEGPEYETIDAFGPLCWNRDFGTIAKANFMCNQFGLDTISTGVVIAFAMECYEKGIITRKDIDDIDLTWGNTDAIIRLIEMIAKREGFGDKLAEGVKSAAKKIGKGAEKYAMHVKGVELPRQEPRSIKAFGLAHATSNRGADHLYALPTIEYGMEEIAEKYLGLSKNDFKKAFDLRSPEYKALEVVFEEKIAAIAEAVGVCKFTTKENFTFTPKELAKAMTLLTGDEWTEEYLLFVGQRIVNVERAFNAREGLTRNDDSLPNRFLNEPYAVPGVVPTTVELEKMLNEYYELEGWDKKTGLPTARKLEELGLKDIAEELKKLNIIVS